MPDEIRRLIRVRNEKGARFKRDGFGKKSQLSDSWRRPRGQHNKQREQRKAKGALPHPGFGSPVSVRGMHPSGFYEVLVYSAADLDGLNTKTHAVRISANVGNRKRSDIQEKALSAGLKVLNAREVPAVTGTSRPAPVKEKEEAVVKKEEEKKAKPKPKKKAKKPPEVKEEKKAPVKPAAKKKAKAEPGEEKPQTAKKPKVQKAKAEDSSEPQAKKSTKPKAESQKGQKEKPKTIKKTAATKKKKTASGVKENE